MATNARRAILQETNILFVAANEPVACFYDSIRGARGLRKTNILYVEPCMIRSRVFGAVRVGRKMCPSGIPLEDATRRDGQNTTKTRMRQRFILRRKMLPPLEILLERMIHL